MGTIKLNFINNSNNLNGSSIVMFQHNEAEDFGEIAIAWKVIENCGKFDNHPFKFPLNFHVSASDSYGNYTPQFQTFSGQAFEMVKDNSGDVLRLSSTPAVNPNEVEVQNNLRSGSIDAHCYKDGKLLAKRTALAPGQKACFEFFPKFYIGVVSQIEEGETINSAFISQISTAINLVGITSADIIITDCKSNQNSHLFNFILKNINK